MALAGRQLRLLHADALAEGAGAMTDLGADLYEKICDGGHGSGDHQDRRRSGHGAARRGRRLTRERDEALAMEAL